MCANMDYSKLSTERRHPKTPALDTFSVEEILRLMDEEERTVAKALRKVRPQISRAVRLIVDSFRKKGRLFFAGAGTSGRMGVLEAAECPPTFNTSPSQIQAFMAGGRPAVFRSQEGAEDREDEARQAVRRKVRTGDVLVGISASGVTPFVRSAVREAARRGASTVLIACNLSPKNPVAADVLIIPRTGPEIISGSTRLKAGTVTKMILNRLTVASMVQLGKVYGNWMVDLQPRSRKLKARALRIVKEIAGVSGKDALNLLKKTRGRVKPALIMNRKKVSYREAASLLKKHGGFIRKVMEV